MRAFLLLLLLGRTGDAVFSQCAVQTGPPPSNASFNTGTNGKGATVPAGSADINWKVTRDSVNGTYQPAVVMTGIPSVYYRSPWQDCAWISFSATGEHTADRFFFFKTGFDLPCFSPCGKSYDTDNTFCISLDLFADNSIYEIYVNGVPQSSNLGNIIPVPNPYKAAGSGDSGRIYVSLCKNWKAGNNTLIIQIASSATIAALLAQAAIIPLPPISNLVSASICEGGSFLYHNKSFTKAGYYLDTFRSVSGCDSVTGLQLTVKPVSYSTISQSVCEGQIFEGHSATGTYKDIFPAANGCDSIRTLNLTVLKKPTPVLGTKTSYCTGDSIRLSPGVFASYLWQDGSAQDYYTVKTPGLYSVTVTNSCGSATAQQAITERTCGIYFPTAFTPNKDGRNDVFKVLTDFTFSEYDLVIYNRWGQIIFETKDASKGWDGNVQGQLQQTGSFIWTCKYTKNNISSVLNGSVLLIR